MATTHAENDKAMNLIDHLRELRTRILVSIVVFFVGFIIAFYFSNGLLEFIYQPIQSALIKFGQDPTLIFTAPQEKFFTLVRISVLGGLLLSFPVIAYQLWAFVAPGLYKNEQLAVAPFLVASPLMFLAGASFAQFVVTPLAMNFFVSFADLPLLMSQIFDRAQNVDGSIIVDEAEQVTTVILPSVRETLDIALKFILAFGVCFQLPVALTLLGKVGLVTADGLKGARKYAIVGIMLLAAIVTPPDVGTQLILFTVVYGLYEVSIWLVKWVQPEYDDFTVDDDEAEDKSDVEAQN